jgi:hypothetical protein
VANLTATRMGGSGITRYKFRRDLNPCSGTQSVTDGTVLSRNSIDPFVILIVSGSRNVCAATNRCGEQNRAWLRARRRRNGLSMCAVLAQVQLARMKQGKYAIQPSSGAELGPVLVGRSAPVAGPFDRRTVNQTQGLGGSSTLGVIAAIQHRLHERAVREVEVGGKIRSEGAERSS